MVWFGRRCQVSAEELRKSFQADRGPCARRRLRRHDATNDSNANRLEDCARLIDEVEIWDVHCKHEPECQFSVYTMWGAVGRAESSLDGELC